MSRYVSGTEAQMLMMQLSSLPEHIPAGQKQYLLSMDITGAHMGLRRLRPVLPESRQRWGRFFPNATLFRFAV